MRRTEGARLDGPAGTATEVIISADPDDPPDWSASIATWFLHCPGQSPAWDSYQLSIVHLRPLDGVAPAIINVPGATHEVLVVALDPALHPTPTEGTWRFLTPVNVSEQFAVMADDDARQMCLFLANAVVNGVLPAEPALSGAREPWHTTVIKTSAHLRGEEHAP